MQVTGTTQRGNDRGIRVVVEMTPEEAGLIGGLAKTAVLHMPICGETAAIRSRLQNIQKGMGQIRKTARDPLSPEESYRRACVRYIREKGWRWDGLRWWRHPDYKEVGADEESVAHHIYREPGSDRNHDSNPIPSIPTGPSVPTVVGSPSSSPTTPQSPVTPSSGVS